MEHQKIIDMFEMYHDSPWLQHPQDPNDRGSITVHCNEKNALRSIEHVYREAASMFPADEDLIKHSCNLARKKQLVSQNHAAGKRAAFVAAHPGEHPTGMPGRKPDVSSPTEPRKDIISPLRIMNIGETSAGSARRPQFTQERSATKKIPQKADGCKDFLTIGAGLSPK
jgi:hypothetical protein